jgi:thermospermine synthase
VPLQLEEDLADDLKWSMRVNQVLYSGKSEYQEVDLIDVGPFGKVRQIQAFSCCGVY